MKKPFSLRELKRIRKAIEAVPGRYNSGDHLHVAIALPYDCNKATDHFAYQLMLALRRVNCTASMSTILTFSREIVSDKPYEVLPYIPIASPCIRVYNRSHAVQMRKRAGLVNKIRHYWHQLWGTEKAIPKTAC